MFKSFVAELSRFFFESNISIYIQAALGLYIFYAFFHAFFNIFELPASSQEVIEESPLAPDSKLIESEDKMGVIENFDIPQKSVQPEQSVLPDVSTSKVPTAPVKSADEPRALTPQGWISVEDFTRRLKDFQDKLNSLNVNTLKNVCSNIPVISNRKNRKNIQNQLFIDIEMMASLLSDSALPDHFIRQSMGFLADMEVVIKKQNYIKTLELLDVFNEQFQKHKEKVEVDLLK